VKATTLILCAGALAACGSDSRGVSGTAGELHIRHAVAWTAGDVKGASMGLEIDNRSDAVDTLVAVTSPRGNAVVHMERPGGGMEPVAVVPLPRHMGTRLGRGLHVMVTEMPEQPKAGETVPVTLRFARAGALDLQVPVLKYSDALGDLGE
jgi:copper(I)-binding protein